MLSLFLARRYLARAIQTRANASSLFLSIIVLVMGSLALALALSITEEFEKKIFSQLQGINASAIIYSYGTKIDPISIATFLKNTHPETIIGVTPQSMQSVILSNNDKQAVITLRGINPVTESSVTTLAEKIVVEKNTLRQSLSTLFDKNNVVIGHSLAKHLGISIGDEITFFVPDTAPSSKRIKLFDYSVKITGIFNVGLEDFDGNTGFCSLDFFNKIFKITNGVDALLIAIAKYPVEKNTSWTSKVSSYLTSNNPFANDHQETIVHLLKKELPHLTVASWKELYPAILSVMKLEKYAVLGIILLLTLIALMNVISTLFALVNRKQRDIALFQAIGMPDETIRNIFIWMGMGLITGSSVVGSTLGWIISFILETYKCIPLPDVYYVNYLPASTSPMIFISVPIITMTLGFIIILISVQHTQKIDALDILRHTA